MKNRFDKNKNSLKKQKIKTLSHDRISRTNQQLGPSNHQKNLPRNNTQQNNDRPSDRINLNSSNRFYEYGQRFAS